LDDGLTKLGCLVWTGALTAAVAASIAASVFILGSSAPMGLGRAGIFAGAAAGATLWALLKLARFSGVKLEQPRLVEASKSEKELSPLGRIIVGVLIVAIIGGIIAMMVLTIDLPP
jgi:hypothetical protein